MWTSRLTRLSPLPVRFPRRRTLPSGTGWVMCGHSPVDRHRRGTPVETTPTVESGWVDPDLCGKS